MEFGLLAKDNASNYLFYFTIDIQSPDNPVTTRTKQYYVLSPSDCSSRAYCFLCVCFCDLSVEPLLRQWLALYKRYFGYISYKEFLEYLLHTAKGVARGSDRYIPFTDEASARLVFYSASRYYKIDDETDAISHHINTPRDVHVSSSTHHDMLAGDMRERIQYLPQQHTTGTLQTQGSRTNEFHAGHHQALAPIESTTWHREAMLCRAYGATTNNLEFQLQQALAANRSLMAQYHQARMEMERWRLECQELRHRMNVTSALPLDSVSREQYVDLERRHRLLHREFDELVVEKAEAERLVLATQQDVARRQEELGIALRALDGVGRGLDYVQRELPLLVTNNCHASSQIA